MPAASTTTVTLPRGSGDVGRVDPADALARMGGIDADYTGHTLLVAPGRLAAIERCFLRAGVFLLPLTYWWGTYDHYVLPKLLLALVLRSGNEIWITTSPTTASPIAGIQFTPYNSGGFNANGTPIADSHGIWFAGNSAYGGPSATGVALYVPGSGFYWMSNIGGQLAGACY